MNVSVRLATINDSRAIKRIYAPYVEDTSITPEYNTPAVFELIGRIDEVMRKYPWIVCEVDDQVVAYAFAEPFRHRAAYAWTVELGVYVQKEYQRHKIATALYECMFALLGDQGIRNAVAVTIGLNSASVAFHHKLGFTLVGTVPNAGFKLGQWHDVLCSVKQLRDDFGFPAPIMTIGQLSPEFLQDQLDKATESISVSLSSKL